jgi:hypothetical protein
MRAIPKIATTAVVVAAGTVGEAVGLYYLCVIHAGAGRASRRHSR